MQQRRLRLGDIVDDYCPRERRITNHAVVAMIEDQVKQTRCTTCDADHEYKQARVPAPRRRKDATSALPGDAGAPRKRPAADAPEANGSTFDPAMPLDTTNMNDLPDAAAEEEPVVSSPEIPAVEATPLNASEASTPHAGENGTDASDNAEPEPIEDDGPVHRRLIRATLPRPEGQPPERKAPEFTMHQRDVNGNRAGRSHRRGPRPGQMRAQQGNGQSSRFGGQRQGPRPSSGQGGAQGQPRRRKRRR